MFSKYIFILLFLICGMVISVRTGKLTMAAALTGGVLGFLIFLGAGFAGIALLTAFFILGTLATMWHIKEKEQLHIAEKNKGRRTAGQVIANAGVAGIVSILMWLFPEKEIVFRIMIAASFASATADTLSSELGSVYGKKFYNILTLQRDQRGLDGVVSLEGTLMGVAGSCVIAIIYALFYGGLKDVFIIILAGTIGNLADSVLGASAERRQYISNDAVNFLNTLIAALFALLLYVLF
ncbi:MAG: DUF92 domain-containing protein [Flavisolibacter sp.]|nr:DUF92 domain-containing protein [Flavisolibacter sp.]